MNIQIGKTYEIQHWYKNTSYTVKVTEITEHHVRMVCTKTAREMRMQDYRAEQYTWKEVA